MFLGCDIITLRLWLPRLVFLLVTIGLVRLYPQQDDEDHTIIVAGKDDEDVAKNDVKLNQRSMLLSSDTNNVEHVVDDSFTRHADVVVVDDEHQNGSTNVRVRRRVMVSSSNGDVHPSQPSLHAPSSITDAGIIVDTSVSPHFAALRWHGLLTLISMLLMLLLGPKSCVTIVGIWLTLICMIQITSIRLERFQHQPRRCGDDDCIDGTFTYSELCFLFLFGLHIFYSTGHTNSFSSLQVSCAFIGFDTFYYYIGGMMLLINTFGHGIIMILMTQLMEALRRSSSSSSSSSSTVLTNAARDVYRLTFSSSTSGLRWLFLLTATRTMLSTLNVYIQRRHLMVWAIFAPKYMFDAIYNVVFGVATIGATHLAAKWAA